MALTFLGFLVFFGAVLMGAAGMGRGISDFMQRVLH